MGTNREATISVKTETHLGGLRCVHTVSFPGEAGNWPWEQPEGKTCFSLLLVGHICVVVVVEVRGNHSGRTVGLVQVLPLL